MSKYYIIRRDTSEIIELDATEELTEAHRGEVTSNPVANKDIVTDSFINTPPIFTLSGVISGVIQPAFKDFVVPPIAERTQLIESTLTEGVLVDFQSADKLYELCVITNLNKRKTAKEGIDSWKVNITLQQINLVDSLKITIDKSPIAEIEDDATEQKKVDQNTTSDVIDIKYLGLVDNLADTFGVSVESTSDNETGG